MNRESALARIREPREWDLAIVGGGATGLSAALDAAARGYSVALFERDDFAHASSSRSTKLVHGGVRYLRQGRIGLVRAALRERGLLLHNAPGLTRWRDFIIPAYSQLERAWYRIGLKTYDLLARGAVNQPSRILSAADARAALPTVIPDGLRGGVLYQDGQFDDAGLALALAASAAARGAAVLNHAPVVGLLNSGGRTRGVAVRDFDTGATFEVRARAVINATGVFADEVRRLDAPGAAPLVAPSQGAHIVLPRRFFPSESALLIPRTSDGRVLFAIPWHGRVLVGTTDTPLATPSREPVPLPAEIDFLLETAARFLAVAPRRPDILSAFAGIRPLVRAGDGPTSALSRDHHISISATGLVTITGGKWTTCRQMGEDVVTRAAAAAGLPPKTCRTADLPVTHPLAAETDSDNFIEPETVDDAFLERATRLTMPRTVEDLLARRSRLLYLDARAAHALAPRAARSLAKAHGRDAAWEADQVRTFQALADRHRGD